MGFYFLHAMISIQELYTLYTEFPCVTTDTRRIVPGSLFFCLRGEKFDGNVFAKDALEAGARGAVVDDPALKDLPGAVYVNNVLQTLQQLALHHRRQLNIPVIGITGTNGKTTTKELVSAVLAARYRVTYTQGNLNNHIGVPLTLLSITKETEIAVVEMGANHPGEIEMLCELALPDSGLITNIGKAHLEGFGSIENIIDTKTALYRSVSKRGGPVFVNAALPVLRSKAVDMTHYLYGDSGDCYCRGRMTSADPFVTVEWEPGQHAETKLAGSWNADNILAAVCIGKFYQVPDDAIRMALEAYTPTNMRSQVKQTGKNTLLLDAYNANPTSMHAAISHFAKGSAENKVLIIGDMLELGMASEQEHFQMLEFIHSQGFQQVYLVGAQFGKIVEYPEYLRFHNTEDLMAYLKIHPLDGKHVLIKGSRGIGLERAVECL